MSTASNGAAIVDAALRIVAGGAMTTVQDLGRRGWRRAGVPRAGVLVPAWLRLANALLASSGQPEDAPVLEAIDGGLVVEAEGAPLHVAIAGPVDALRIAGEGTAPRRIAPWSSLVLHPGERLKLGAPSEGRVGIVAVAGLQVPLVLGSASTYTRAGFGGQEGRALRAGDRLRVRAGALPAMLARVAQPPAAGTGPIRVVPGPQQDHFDDDVRAMWQQVDWFVTREADRMGLRLEGPKLVHRADRGAEIVTDAAVPGSIQVPGHGQPIVLSADAHTAGGYPKIATVISADLPRLAAGAIGSRWRFREVTLAEAEQAADAAQVALQAARASIVAVPRPADEGGAAAFDAEALASSRLVSGFVDALSPQVEPAGAGEPSIPAAQEPLRCC